LPLPFSLEHHQRRRQWQQATIAFFAATTPQKKTTAHCHHLLLLKHKKTEGKEFTFKLPLYLLTFGSRFCPSISNAFSWHLFLLKQKKRKNNYRGKKNAKKGRSFPSSSYSTLSLLAPSSALPLLPFYFKCFFLVSSSFQAIFFKKKK